MESRKKNTDCLLEYKSKLIVFPQGSGVLKNGDLTKEGTVALTYLVGRVNQPVTKKADIIEMMTITEEMNKNVTYTQMRLAKKETKVAGQCAAVAAGNEK